MRSIFMLDEPQLRQVEAKLAEMTALSSAEQTRKQCLIDALLREKTELSRYRSRARRPIKLAA
jgi:hypothetical protein